jgi:hypothetical protein
MACGWMATFSMVDHNAVRLTITKFWHHLKTLQLSAWRLGVSVEATCLSDLGISR